MIKIEDFIPVTLKDNKLFADHYAKFPQSHSEYVFTSLVSWSHYAPAFYLFRENDLILMTLRDGKAQFRPPIGVRRESVLREVLDLAKKDGGARPLIAIDEEAKNWIHTLYPEMRMTEDRDFFDYVYLAESLAKLPGKHYLTHRNHLNKFRKRYNYSVEKIAPADIVEVGKFLQKWCLWRDCKSEPMLEAERTAILFCIDHFFEMMLSGIVIRIDGEIQALSVYEPMNAETAVIHFEKAITDYEGIYPAINNEAAKILSKGYKYINRESDLGIPGLRTAKERLHPDHMVKVYYTDKEEL